MRSASQHPFSPRLARRARRLLEEAFGLEDRLPDTGPLGPCRGEVDALMLAIGRCTSRLARAGAVPRLPRGADAPTTGAVLKATYRRLGHLIWPEGC